MKIAIVGYGKMGKAIEKIATGRGHLISAIVSSDHPSRTGALGSDTDVAIEFSVPEAAVQNITRCIDEGIPVVSGTTGWTDELPTVHHLVEKKNGTFFYASNYSLGVNIFFRLNEWLAEVMTRYPQYETEIEEIHHIHKLDKPSGTAITLAEGIIDRHARYEDWSLDTTHQKDRLPIRSLRIGEVPGTHTVRYNSEQDQLTLTHTARGREGFALGAVLVAEWLAGKKGVFTMNDFLKI